MPPFVKGPLQSTATCPGASYKIEEESELGAKIRVHDRSRQDVPGEAEKITACRAARLQARGALRIAPAARRAVAAFAHGAQARAVAPAPRGAGHAGLARRTAQSFGSDGSAEGEAGDATPGLGHRLKPERLAVFWAVR